VHDLTLRVYALRFTVLDSGFDTSFPLDSIESGALGNVSAATNP